MAKREALLTSPNPHYGSAARDYYMARIVKVIELLAESEKSWEDAVRTALEQARKTLRHIRSIYVEDFEAIVTAGEIQAYRINAKISFDLEAANPRLSSNLPG